MLGEDRPEEIAPGDELSLGLPEPLVFRVPILDPGRPRFRHRAIPSFCGRWLRLDGGGSPVDASVVSRGTARPWRAPRSRTLEERPDQTHVVSACSTSSRWAGSRRVRPTTSPTTMIAGALRWAR